MTDVRILSGNQPVDGLVMASADQDTIVGNGTTADPFRAGSALSGFRFHAVVSDGTPQLGLFMTADSLLMGVTRVAPGDAKAVGGSGKQICGVIVEIVDGASDVVIQSGGMITLTTDAWDDVTEGSGGLSAGSAYYLVTSPGHTPGNAITTPPSDPGEFTVLVGVALSTTTMLTTSIPSVVFENP